MAAVTITGVVTACESRRRTDPDYLGVRRYSPGSEMYLHRLNVGVTTPDGKRYYFDSPAYREVVTSAPGVAVVIYDPEHKDAPAWYAETGGSGVATAERANANGLTPKVKVGDTLTVRGSVKYVKAGYTAFNRVRRVEPVAA
jgi:hypothetical protein